LKNAEKSPVYIRCDRSVPYGVWATVIDSLKQAKITNINVVTEPLNTKGTP
jgi:biopolymer transport protein ExbD